MERLEFAAFIPHRLRAGTREFFIQKRDMHAKRSPGVFGLFGGVIEKGETPAQALIREVGEELAYTPVAHRFFFRYELACSVLHVFSEEVSSDFERRVQVLEGEYGKFFTLAELATIPMSPFAGLALVELDKTLEA